MRAIAWPKAQISNAHPTARTRRHSDEHGIESILDLQRKAGNQAVVGLLGGSRGVPSKPVVSRYEVQDCGSGAGSTHPANEVYAAHGRARTMLSIAEMESATGNDPTVRALARKYFKLAVPPVSNYDKKLCFGRVRQVLTAMNRRNSETTYECEPAQSWQHGLCTKGSMAVTILNIHLCPGWWTLTSNDDRAFVLLHEWAHRYGPSVNQILETYCDATEFGSLSADDLVAEPDAYASYIFELVTGTAPSSTVC